jgi:hypothetical protein
MRKREAEATFPAFSEYSFVWSYGVSVAGLKGVKCADLDKIRGVEVSVGAECGRGIGGIDFPVKEMEAFVLLRLGI